MSDSTATHGDSAHVGDVADQGLDAVIISVTVPADPTTAFDIFCASMSSWWPTSSHSVGDERVARVEFDPHAGGHVSEVWDDGTRHIWADVVAYDPPDSFVLDWNAGGYGTGRPSTTVAVSFTESGPGETVVRLEHTGWERLGPEPRGEYAEGWVVVLGDYVARVTG